MKRILIIALILIVHQTNFSYCSIDDIYDEVFGDTTGASGTTPTTTIDPDYEAFLEEPTATQSTTTTKRTTSRKPTTTATTERTTIRRADPPPVVPQDTRISPSVSDWEEPEVRICFKNASYL
jgi:hypothetical protein